MNATIVIRARNEARDIGDTLAAIYRQEGVPSVEVVVVEKPKNYGTFGAHGIGEPPISSPASAMINALYNAVGVWVEDIPLTRARVLAALKSQS